MNLCRSQFMGLMWASIVVVFFTAVATITIVAWSPLLAEANATDMNRDDMNTANDYSPYIALHQTESWRYTVVLRERSSMVSCPR